MGTSVGIVGATSLMLVKCKPLLSGRMSRQDLQRLTTDDAALERAIDAYADDPAYSADEVRAVVRAVTLALLPEDAALADEILRGLPLNLLSDESDTTYSPTGMMNVQPD